MAGSVSRARYKRRPKGNFLTGVITRPCVHTSSPATFPQLLAQLAPSPASMRRQLLHATASWRRIRRIRTRLPIDQLNHSATNVSGNVIGRGRSDFFPRMIGIFFFCFVRSFVCFCFFFFDVEFVDEISTIEIHWWGILSRIFIDFTDFTVIRERN